MGGAVSTPRWSGGGMRPAETSEHLIGGFVAEKSYPLGSDYWQKLLELPIDLHWPSDRVLQACRLFAQNNCHTRHLAKILIHLTWCLQECVTSSGVPSTAPVKALNALYISSVFLKYLIENAKSDNFEELHLSIDGSEPLSGTVSTDQNFEHLVMDSVLAFLGKVDVSDNAYLLHNEELNFILIAIATQLLSGLSPGPDDIHPFMDALMV